MCVVAYGRDTMKNVNGLVNILFLSLNTGRSHTSKRIGDFAVVDRLGQREHSAGGDARDALRALGPVRVVVRRVAVAEYAESIVAVGVRAAHDVELSLSMRAQQFDVGSGARRNTH